eukprot:6451060-Heterocapsa_arctica.AAC.1
MGTSPAISRRKIWPSLAGASTIPVLSAFLPVEIGSIKADLVKSFCLDLQYLHVPCVGGPVQVLPKSLGLSAHDPQTL